ncbi:MAG: redoxin domain-containing protein [Betaproteobacteria bacterium]|nr:MAG: redoxin domain-containing protein [Betaproteobacteria bacterium]
MRTVPEDTMPGFEAGLVGGRAWRLAEEHPSKLALLAFYRGVHCPICRHWLGELERLVPRFTEHGVSVIALSCDTRERAERAKREWRLEQLRIGYGVNPDDARKAGLYLTEEADHHLYTEPAILAVKPEDGTLYASWVQSSPHARPHFAEVLSAVESMLATDLPRPPGGA